MLWNCHYLPYLQGTCCVPGHVWLLLPFPRANQDGILVWVDSDNCKSSCMIFFFHLNMSGEKYATDI